MQLHNSMITTGFFTNFRANLLNRYPGTNVKTLLFNGIKHGTGCSTAALECATSLTGSSLRRVLLVHLDLGHEPSKTAKIRNYEHHKDNRKDGKPEIEKTGPGELFVTSLSTNSLCGSMGVFQSSKLDRFLNAIHDKFDHIILDAPPVLIHQDLRSLCSNTDGVVMVIASGQARRPIALRAKKEIEDAGGRILGVVLNRMKYYIPGWLYQKL